MSVTDRRFQKGCAPSVRGPPLTGLYVPHGLPVRSQHPGHAFDLTRIAPVLQFITPGCLLGPSGNKPFPYLSLCGCLPHMQ